MIRYIYGADLDAHPKLSRTMFRDRADQFQRRLGWEVTVDDQGFERDAYDALNPLYVIWERPDGTHGGSMRFLPTTGRTMINDHFQDVTGSRIVSPRIWECTRFCLAADAAPNTSAVLMLGGAQLFQRFQLTHFAGVFDQRMVRIYSRIGAAPEVLGSTGEGRERISVGLWSFNTPALHRLHRSARVSAALSSLWATRAFGHMAVPQAA